MGQHLASLARNIQEPSVLPFTWRTSKVFSGVPSRFRELWKSPPAPLSLWQPPSLRTNGRSKWAGSSPLLWPIPLAGNLASCKMPERQGVGEGEAKGLYKSALNAPIWLPRASCCLTSSLPRFPGKLKPPTETLKNPTLLPGEKPNAHPACISKSSALVAIFLWRGF